MHLTHQIFTMPDLQEYLLLLLIWITSIILLQAFFSKTRPKLRLPPSPLALPVIGHIHRLAPIPHQALHKLSLRHGPLIHLYIGSSPCVVASSPEVAKEILKTNESSFLNRPKTANIDYLTYGSADFTLAPYGPYWKFIKQLCMSQLLGGRTLELLLPVRREEILRFLQLMGRKSMAAEAVDVGAELVRLTNNIISRVVLSKRCSEKEDEAGEVRKLMKEMTELAGKFNLSDSIWFCRRFDLQGFGRRLKDVRDRYDCMMERIIKEHEEARKKKGMGGSGGDGVKDLLDLVLDIYEDESSEIKLTRENMKAFIMNMFGAGTDTSSITIEWALAELINHPNVMEKARQEIASVVGDSRIVEESDILKLPYLQAIVKETLRLHPPGPLIVRESTEHCTVAGYDIPAKTRLFVNVWALGRDPRHWENPLVFRPERFEESQLDVRGQHFQFLPFGSGRRSCPGTSLALLLVQTSLAAMIQCFEWRVGDGKNGGVDMKEGLGISMPRANSLVCVPVARLNPSLLL